MQIRIHTRTISLILPQSMNLAGSQWIYQRKSCLSRPGVGPTILCLLYTSHRQDLQISDSHRQDSHNRNSHETLQGQHSELQGPVSRLPGRNMQFAGVPVRGTGVISAIHPRKTRISRISPPADPWGAHLEQVLAVNVTQLVIVASCVAPPFKMGSIERYLMTVSYTHLDVYKRQMENI